VEKHDILSERILIFIFFW